MPSDTSSESSYRDGDHENQLEAINDHANDGTDDSNNEDDLWGSGDVHQLPVAASYHPSTSSAARSYHPLSNELGAGPDYFTDGSQKRSTTQPLDVLNRTPPSHLDHLQHNAIQGRPFPTPIKSALIDDFVKASQKMKQKYLTQRFMYDVNKRRIQDQLKKKFGKPRPKTSKDGSVVIFLMTVEAAYALRRLFRIERCYRYELIQPLGNRISQRVKISLFSMRRAYLFFEDVAFACVNSDDFAFMIPAGTCSDAFDGSRRSIHHFTKGCHSSPPSFGSHQGRQYSIANYAPQELLLLVNKGDSVFILDDRHEQSEGGIKDPNTCYWYFAFMAHNDHSGLLLRFGDRWLPIRARFGWVPSACIHVDSPVSMQYSLMTFKFRLESPRLRITPDGACFFNR